MYMLGYKGSLHTYQYWDNAYDNGTLPHRPYIHVGVISAGLQWLTAPSPS